MCKTKHLLHLVQDTKNRNYLIKPRTQYEVYQFHNNYLVINTDY